MIIILVILAIKVLTPLYRTLLKNNLSQQNFYFGLFVYLNEIKLLWSHFIHSMYYLFARPLGALVEGGVEFDNPFSYFRFKKKK